MIKCWWCTNVPRSSSNHNPNKFTLDLALNCASERYSGSKKSHSFEVIILEGKFEVKRSIFYSRKETSSDANRDEKEILRRIDIFWHAMMQISNRYRIIYTYDRKAKDWNSYFTQNCGLDCQVQCVLQSLGPWEYFKFLVISFEFLSRLAPSLLL